jgi:ribonucleotide reductase beta subunit family protein with ferritin-like domain
MSHTILDEEPDRQILHPIRWPTIYKSYQDQLKLIWFATDIDFTKDKNDWIKLDKAEQTYIKSILAFFAKSDILVAENIEENFKKDVKCMEARMCYNFQQSMENIHNDTYARMLKIIVETDQELENLLTEISNHKGIQLKAQWVTKWMNREKYDYPSRLIAMAAVEGIFFSGAFCSIYWLKSKKIMPGLGTANDYISRDENKHVEFARILHETLGSKKCSETLAREIVADAVEVETKFITEIFECRLIGMNSELMKEYIKFVANKFMRDFGYAELYPKVSNPFLFMDYISLSSKKNFFENKPTEYSIKVDPSDYD